MIETILLFLAGVLCYYVLWKPQRYWVERNVKQGQSVPLLGDSAKIFFGRESFLDMVLRTYNRHPKERYEGVYQMTQHVLMLRDPDLIKQLAVKDFDHFTDHGDLVPDGNDPLWNKALFSLKGDKWRDMRATLSPAFTSSKMRSMFCLINESAEQFVNYYVEKNEKEVVVDMKDSFSRYANDVIATCAFGIKCNSLKEQDNNFYLMGKDAADFSKLSLKIFVNFVVPSIAKFLNFTIYTAEVSKFFSSIVKDTLRIREEKKIVRPDMINLLMEARKGRLRHEEDVQEKDAGFATAEESDIGKIDKHQQTEFSDIDIAAQALIFFFAGFETVSTLTSFMAYELAIHPKIQEKLRQEVAETQSKCNGKLTYETLSKMIYMDMVICETLRKWPPAAVTERVCVKPYTVQPTNRQESPIHLKTGDVIWLPIYGLHMDETYYPNPEKFDPEHFNDENKHKINPYTYMPFGSGPRSCLGSRFALMEVKTVFYHILSKFEITAVENTPIPMVISRNQFNLGSANGYWLGLRRTN